MLENGSGLTKHFAAAIPAAIIGVIVIIGSIATVALYGTPWESKERADANQRVFEEQIEESNNKLKEVAELNKETASKLVDVETGVAVESAKQAEEDRRLEMLESWHRK